MQIRFTDQGLIAVSSDRYQLVRTLAEYLEPASVGAPTVLLRAESIKMLLPVLKAAKSDPVTVAVDDKTVTVTCNGQVPTFENCDQYDSLSFPNLDGLFRLHQADNVALSAEPLMSVNPGFLHSITTMLKRYSGRNEPVQFSLDRSHPGKPIAWMMGDWAHGLLMPVRTESFRTRADEERNGGGLVRLFDAVNLPVPEPTTTEAQAAAEAPEPVPAGL